MNAGRRMIPPARVFTAVSGFRADVWLPAHEKKTKIPGSSLRFSLSLSDMMVSETKVLTGKG